MCKNNNNRCFYDYNSTLSPEALVLTEAIPFINANREEKERVSLEDLLQVLESDGEVIETVEKITEPEIVLDQIPVEDADTIDEVECINEEIEEDDKLISISEEYDKYEILMQILNKTYNPSSYNIRDLVKLTEIYRGTDNEYVKQLLREALIKTVFEN